MFPLVNLSISTYYIGTFCILSSFTLINPLLFLETPIPVSPKVNSKLLLNHSEYSYGFGLFYKVLMWFFLTSCQSFSMKNKPADDL